MSSITLVESAKLSQDQLIEGVVEEIATVNPLFELMPFVPIDGNALSYNREKTLGDVQYAGVGATITAKNPATFDKVTSNLTTLIGDAEVNGLIQATRSNLNDQTAIQVASKAKSLGRQYQNSMINGDGTGDSIEGLLSLVDSGQIITGDSGDGNGDVLKFDYLDELIDLVSDKDGQVDFIMMNSRTHRSFKALLRGLGGASINDVLDLPSGRKILGYEGIPVFRNDWIPTNQVQGSSSTCSSIFAGTFDDGSGKHGVAGLTASNAAGIKVEDVGISETKDERITRLKWYCGLALFSSRGLACLKGIKN